MSRFPIGGYNVHTDSIPQDAVIPTMIMVVRSLCRSVGSFREPGQDNGLVFARSLKYILGGSAIG